ncbi:MAG TPA: hypothetical protein VFA12_08000 [Stellaceae bacterium]|nr:hypothetical protein [Stellaceae bacterium]
MKFVVAAAVIFGFHYAVKWGAATLAAEQFGDRSQAQWPEFSPAATDFTPSSRR